MNEKNEAGAPLQFRYAADLAIPIERAVDFVWKPEAMEHWVPWGRKIVYRHPNREGYLAVGSTRDVHLAGGIIGVEHITRLEPGRLCAYTLEKASLGSLTFVRLDWLVDGHEGEMVITPNADGSTHLVWSTYFKSHPGRGWLAPLTRRICAFLVGKMIGDMEKTCLREKQSAQAVW